jgi:hypothetical protein
VKPRLSDATYSRKGRQERERSTHGREKFFKFGTLKRCRKLG